jgi:hypothetical protein
MKSLKITPETLKNQRDVVSEEVRVNVLNQPYGAFEGSAPRAKHQLIQRPHFLRRSQGARAATSGREEFFDTYYAPNNAVLVVSGDTTADEVMKLAEKHFGGIPSRTLHAAPGHRGRRRPRRRPSPATRWPGRRRSRSVSPAGSHDEGFLRAVLLDPLLVSDEARSSIGADQGKPDRVRGRAGLATVSQQLRLQRPDASFPRRLPSDLKADAERSSTR